MAAKRDEMTLWTGYFDSRLSRSNGRRVPKQASIPKPTLAKEGRLVMPPSHVFEVTGTSSKEGAMQAIGTALNRRSKEAKEQGKETSRGPAKGDRRRRAQRKPFKHRKSPQRKKKFGRK